MAGGCGTRHVLTQAAPAPLAGPSARDAQVAGQQQELLQQLSSIIASPTFYKRSLGAKSAAVRQAAYVAISRMCQAAPAALDASLAEASSAVLGALHEKEAVNHGAMWEMVLGFIKVRRAWGGQRWPLAWDAPRCCIAAVVRWNRHCQCCPCLGCRVQPATPVMQHPALFRLA